MRVAFIGQPFDHFSPPAQGGSLAIWTDQVTRRLTDTCDFLVYARRGHTQPKTEWFEGIQYRRISTSLETQLLKPFKLIERLLGYPKPTLPLFASRIYHFGYILQIAKDLKQQQCDIVHIHNFSQFAPIVRAFNPHVKIVLHMHCEWLIQLDQRAIEQRLAYVDRIISCSDYVTQKTRSHFPKFADRCSTVWNGVDIDHFGGQNDHSRRPKPEKKRLLFVGRVSPEKGVHVLLDAFKIVASQSSRVELEIVGPPGEASFEFIALVSDDDKTSNLASFYSRVTKTGGGNYYTFLQEQVPNNLKDRVHFAGPVPYSRLVNHYQNANILVFPSVWHEPFGMPVVEAMACHLPVIATKSGGIPEIVQPGETGLLVERDDAASLAEAILKLLNNDDLTDAMGRNGRQRVAIDFTWDQVAKNLLNQYQTIYG